MRTVFDNSMTAHVWAQNEQYEGRSNNGNLYFRDGVIYSYGSHFPIARHAVTKQGKPCVLMTTRGYSPSTSQHISCARGALRVWEPEARTARDLKLTFFVDNVLAVTKKDHLENYKGLRESYASALHIALFIKSFDSVKELSFDWVEELAEKCREYSKAFGLGQRVTVPTENLERKKAEWLVAKVEYDAKQEEWRKAAAERKRKFHAREVERWADGEIERLSWGNNAEITPEHQARRDVIDADVIKSWRDGKEVRLPYSHHSERATMMRVKGDEVQTSMGARFPVEHAKKAFKVVERCRRNEVEYVRNGHSIPVGHFTLDRIHPNGDVRAGCHFVRWAEIELCARELGILTGEPV